MYIYIYVNLIFPIEMSFSRRMAYDEGLALDKT